MKNTILITLPLVGCLAFASCFPIERDRPRPGQETPAEPEANVTSDEQQKIEAQRERMKERQEKREKQAAERKREAREKEQKPVSEPKKEKNTADYPFANPVPGKEGFVFSPYNQKLVDVREIPSGTLVRDPTFAPAEKKFFRVP